MPYAMKLDFIDFRGFLSLTSCVKFWLGNIAISLSLVAIRFVTLRSCAVNESKRNIYVKYDRLKEG